MHHEAAIATFIGMGVERLKAIPRATLARQLRNVGILGTSACVYMLWLESHYKEHPGARGDGWIPLEWRSYEKIASIYAKELELGKGQLHDPGRQ